MLIDVKNFQQVSVEVRINTQVVIKSLQRTTQYMNGMSINAIGRHRPIPTLDTWAKPELI